MRRSNYHRSWQAAIRCALLHLSFQLNMTHHKCLISRRRPNAPNDLTRASHPLLRVVGAFFGAAVAVEEPALVLAEKDAAMGCGTFSFRFPNALADGWFQ